MACIPPPDGGDDPPDPFGITIDNVSTSHSRDRCFNVSLSYRVRPTISHNSFEVTYGWDSALYKVSGLKSPRTLTPLAGGTYRASEEFEVCASNLTGSTILFPFTIEALADHDRTKPREWFRKSANAPYIFGSETWQTDLNDEIASLKAQIDGGDNNPFVLRRYWRLIGTLYHGGTSQYAAYLRQRVRTEVPNSAAAAQSTDYYALLLRNGENVSVMFSPLTGQIVSINFNQAYQLSRSYHTELIGMLQRGLVSRLLGVDSADSFELVSEKEVGSLTMLRYRRVREGVTLLPDKLVVFIEPSGDGYSIRSIVSSLGDVLGATCGRVDRRLINRHNPAHDRLLTVIWSGQFLYRHEGAYRCVYLWHSEKQIPLSGNMKANHIRIVDMQTGEVLLDADGIKPDGDNDDVHHFDTYLTVPYKTPANDWYDVPTRLPSLRAWAMGPESDPLLYNDYYDPLHDGFVPSEVIDDLDPADDHTAYRYLQIFEHKPEGSGVPPTIHNFIPWGAPWTFPYPFGDFNLYGEYVNSVLDQGYGHFFPNLPTANPADFVVPYHFEFDGPDQYVNLLTRAAAATAQAYSMVQYSRYIWGLTNWGGGNFGSSPWTDGPSNRCSGDEELTFTVVPRGFSPCGLTDTACQDSDWIVVHSDSIDDQNSVMTVLAHEYGHWVSNVQPVGYHNKENHTQFAKVEAYALHSVSSLWANWLLDGNMRGDYPSSDPDRLFAGNVAYASLLFDHHTGNMYGNARIFAGMYNQYMNMVGSYYTDPVIGWAYFQSADYHHPGQFCKLEALDYGGNTFMDYSHDAAELYNLMLNKDYANRMVTVNPPGGIIFGPNFVKKNTIEITRAAKQHDWLQLMGMEYPSRVSASPSHAHSITASGNQATVVKVKYTPSAREKWVNFFASANVKYNIFAFGGAGQEIELYRVGQDTQGGRLKLLGENAQCTDDTIPNAPPDNLAVVDVEKTHDTCPIIAGIAQPSITFTPKKSGWFYALIKGTVLGEGLIVLEPAGTQITATNKSASPAFDANREWRLGQSIPVSIPGPPAYPRRGAFMEPTEYHHWKFQHYPPTRLNGYSDRGDPSRPSGLFLTSGVGPGRLNMDYIIRVVRPDDGTVLQLLMGLGRSDGQLVPPGQLNPHLVQTSAPGPLPGQVTDEWTIRARVLNSVAQQQGGNVLLRLRRSPMGTIRQQWEYDIYVVNKNSNQPNWMYENDTTSFQGGSDGDVDYSGIYTVPRWCNGENIELTLDNFQITERLSPDDADYFQIWLEEGEHLNITYRGRIPAAIDVDGPDKPARTMSGSMLNDFIIREVVDGGFDRADHYTVGFGDTNWVNDYRPVLTDQSQVNCVDAACVSIAGISNCCEDEYFAQRGYLWSFNTCSASDDLLAPLSTSLECTHLPHELYSTANINTDNALHLTLTAFITGRYTIRVRSQNDHNVKLDGHWLWSFPASGIDSNRVGSPYTLDFNLGVFPNKLRPHWQWLQEGADPAPSLACSRSGI